MGLENKAYRFCYSDRFKYQYVFSVDKKNQLDVTFCILYFSSNSCSTCFGQPCAHHQEPTTAWCYSLVWHLVGFSYPHWITMHGQPHIRFTSMYVHDTRNSGKVSSVSVVARIRLDVWGSVPARDTMFMGLLIYGWRYGEFHYNLRIGRSRALKSMEPWRHIAGWRYVLMHTHTSALEANERSNSRPGYFARTERAHGYRLDTKLGQPYQRR